MKQRSGFTLVELSIVLVIIGLLIGGVLIGQSLIDSAKITAQIKQLQQFDIAMQNYKLNFNKLAGEDASVQLGVSATPGSYGTGYGNKLYDASCCVTHPGGDFRLAFSEAVFAFVDLSRTGMISEKFTINPGPAQDGSGHQSLNGFSTGSYLPAAKLKADNKPSGVIPVTNMKGDVFWFVGMSPASAYSSTSYLYYNGPGIFPVDALAVDKKLDDGIPSTGDVVAVANTPETTDTDYYPLPVDTGTCVSGSIYNTSATTLQCALLVKAAIN